ncbi:MAG TPA: ATP-binding protein [Acidimicrobiia bacterium]|nr:ATP-binding protein [Acidimicrobiia bacterium]
MPRAEHHISGDLDAPARSRRLTEGFLGGHARLGDLTLAVSELVANAVLHGNGTAARGLVLRLDQDDQRVRVGVEHDGAAFDPTVDRPFHGLGMVDQIVDRWGIDARDGRVLVWFELDQDGELTDHSEAVRADPGDTVRDSPGLRHR